MDFPATIGSGLLGGTVMVVILYMGMAMMPGQMKMNLLYLLGTMMFRQKAVVYMAGAMAHAGMSIVFALIHVGIYEAIGLGTAVRPGALHGLRHGNGNDAHDARGGAFGSCAGARGFCHGLSAGDGHGIPDAPLAVRRAGRCPVRRLRRGIGLRRR